jgi:hypothetical protein
LSHSFSLCSIPPSFYLCTDVPLENWLGQKVIDSPHSISFPPLFRAKWFCPTFWTINFGRTLAANWLNEAVHLRSKFFSVLSTSCDLIIFLHFITKKHATFVFTIILFNILSVCPLVHLCFRVVHLNDGANSSKIFHARCICRWPWLPFERIKQVAPPLTHSDAAACCLRLFLLFQIGLPHATFLLDA